MNEDVVEGTELDFGGGKIAMNPRHEGIPILGTVCSMNNSSGAEIRHRIAKAWNCFHAHRDLWNCLRSTRLQRIRLLERLITGSLLYACQVWNPTVRELRALRGVGQRMYALVLHLPGVHGDTPEQYVRKRKRFIRHLRETCHLPEWDEVCRRRQWWFARQFCASNPAGLTRRLLSWRGSSWLEEQKRRFGTQGHHWHLRAWRWEAQFAKFWRTRGTTCDESARIPGLWGKWEGVWVLAKTGVDESGAQGSSD